MEPENRISNKALTVWKISGLIGCSITWVIGIALLVLTIVFNWSYWMIGVLIIFSIIQAYLTIFLMPGVKWKRWRYEVRNTEIDIQSGIFVIKRTLIPMIRVQHVETKQGPLLRKHDLASVEISTAATMHVIPALDLDEADELRRYISRMASVEEEDV
ncbi:PH domain-containing protein [Peribacillus muralis]|uniref:PH domain-containing protein n=1 Tax=Peribacillus muralis TaxID=264697 RepID=UPI00070A882F|nr:PH domain-containing protein [Peribacillus muralis]MCK1995507.1 PH domain-containing protein [Peribacillus muralis]MCK2016091.1 PH domain-containing protein [Peribacillus muralis]